MYVYFCHFDRVDIFVADCIQAVYLLLGLLNVLAEHRDFPLLERNLNDIIQIENKITFVPKHYPL